MILSSVVAAAVAYPYPMPMPMPVAMAYPQQVPTYISAPKFEEPIERSDVHHGYDEHLGRVKMQVRRTHPSGP